MSMTRFLLGLLLGAAFSLVIIVPITWLTGWDSDEWNAVAALIGAVCGCIGVMAVNE